MTPNPFNAINKTLAVSATATASTSIALPNLGNALRVVNEGPNIVFLAITQAATPAVATLPAVTPGAATLTSIPVIPGDTTLTIPNDQIYNISAICRGAGTALLDIQVGEGQ